MAKRLGHLWPWSKELLSRIANLIPPFLQKEALTDFEELLVRFDVHPAEAVELLISPKEFISEELNNSVNIL